MINKLHLSSYHAVFCKCRKESVHCSRNVPVCPISKPLFRRATRCGKNSLVVSVVTTYAKQKRAAGHICELRPVHGKIKVQIIPDCKP